MSEQAAAGQLRAFVERIERLDGEIAELNADKRDVFAEAKGNGFDVKALKAVIGIRRKDPGERAEHNAQVALYLSTLGMADAAEEVEHSEPRALMQVHVHTRGDETRQSGGSGASASAQLVGLATGTAEAGGTGQPVSIPATWATSPSNAGSQGVTVGGDESGTAATASRESADETPARLVAGLMGEHGSAEAPANSHVGGQHDAPEHQPVVLDRQPQSQLGGDKLAPQSQAPAKTEGRHLPRGSHAGQSGVTAGETATLSSDRIARRDAKEAELRERNRQRSLDPTHPLYAIQYRARHGCDPEPGERAA